jgi:hypothetical protein
LIGFTVTPGGQAGEVGARVGFRITLAPADFAAADLGQVLFLLLLSAELQQCRAEHGDTETVQGTAGADPRHLLTQHFHLGLVEAATAVFNRPVRHRPTPFGHAFAPQELVGMFVFGVAPAGEHVLEAAGRGAHAVGAIFLQPGARVLAELV